MTKLTKDERDEALALQQDLLEFLIERTKGGVDLHAVFAAMLYQTCVVAKMGNMTEDDFMKDVRAGFRNMEAVHHD